MTRLRHIPPYEGPAQAHRLWAASGASILALAPDSTVRWTTAIIDP